MAQRIRSIRWLALAVLLALFAFAPIAGAAPARQAADAVDAADQPVVGDSITVASVTAAADGWIVAHLDEGGKPGKVLGQTQVKAGANKNVAIKLSEAVPVGGKLWPMLHIDAGTAGTYEFPGPDAPVKDAAGAIVMKQITVTDAPKALPTTGGGADMLPALLLGALALLLGGYALRARRA